MSIYALPYTMKCLKEQARKSAVARGHKLERFKPLHSHTAVADCTNPHCYANVYCTTQLAPNGIDISGLAVSVQCGGAECTHKV